MKIASRKLILSCSTFVSLFISAGWAKADVITVTRANTDDIVIPVFDTGLGTLTGVSLLVTLLPGYTNIGGATDPISFQIQSSNTRSNTMVSPFGGTVVSSTGASDIHTISTPNYSGGGLNLGGFASTTSSAGGHSFNVGYTLSSYSQVGPSAFRANVIMNPGAYPGHDAFYSAAAKTLGFSGTSLTPFLASSDIVIGAGTISTSSSGAATFYTPSFSVTTSTSTGSWTWNFNGSSFNTGNHTLTLDPRFTTTTVFTYDAVSPVPEPSSIALLALGSCGLATGEIIRRRKAVAL